MTYETDGIAEPLQESESPKVSTEKICVYCREPLNEGATVCRACGRRSPRTQAEKEKLYWIIFGLAVLICGTTAIIVSVSNTLYQDRVIDRIVFCAHAHGDSTATADFVRFELNDERQPGVSWQVAANFMLLSNGCTPEQ